MTRILLSFPIAALGSSFLWHVTLFLANHEPTGLRFLQSVLFLALAVLAVSIALGLPVLPLVRRYSLTGYWQVAGLGVFMAFLLPCLFVLFGTAVTVVDTGSLPKAPHFDDVIVPIVFVGSIGFVGTSFIWVLGVRGNPFFEKGRQLGPK